MPALLAGRGEDGPQGGQRGGGGGGAQATGDLLPAFPPAAVPFHLRGGEGNGGSVEEPQRSRFGSAATDQPLVPRPPPGAAAALTPPCKARRWGGGDRTPVSPKALRAGS